MNRSATKRASVRLYSCSRCGGSAYLENMEEDEWRCLQCGRTVPSREPQPVDQPRQAVA